MLYKHFSIKKINKFIKTRNFIAKTYDKYLKNLPIHLPKIKKNNVSSFHLYVIKLKKLIQNIMIKC